MGFEADIQGKKDMDMNDRGGLHSPAFSVKISICGIADKQPKCITYYAKILTIPRPKNL